MQQMRSKIRGSVYVFTIFLTVSLCFFPFRSFAGDTEIMIDEMVKQGIITREQGDQMLKNMKEMKAKEQEKLATEQAKGGGEQEKAGKKGYVPGEGRTFLTSSLVNLTLGGFIEMTGIYRNRYSGSDVNSKWNLGGGGFPLRNSPNYYTDEFRGTARQSRLSLLAQGQEDYASLAAYFELDFLGGGSGTSANSVESNSYTPRIRHLYATYDDPNCGWHLLAGQSWSLLTMDKTGIVPRQENIPLTIDAQYVPGFTWTRNPQVRLVKDFGSMLSVGLSVESPQASIVSVGVPLSTTTHNYTVTLANPNNLAYFTSTANNSNEPANLSLDQYPDVVGKVAFDPGFGHYEVYGLARFFTDRTLFNGSRSNNTTVGWGVGGAVLLPVIPKLLDLQGSILAGQGIGRYGSAGFSDAVVNPITGKLDPIREVEALVGLVAHPTDRLDIYAYGGMEKVSHKDVLILGSFLGGFGNPDYASPLNLVEGNTTSTANVEASGVEQATLGAWYSFYKGRYGLMKVGFSYAYSHLSIFGLPGHDENMNTVMLSLRYYF